MQNSKGDASTSMEKFEFDDERNLEIFSGFVGRAKDVLTTLIENIKDNIKEYETKIEDTSKEIEDNELSREKCEHEITKMESKIDDIKDAIENVENTYKKIADAYSSTSKGETKELYSEIIDGAKANCERDVEKNRSEIARLNSDIEAIKNNISEFSKIIDELTRNQENYNLELFKYNKSLEYMEKVAEKTNVDLDEIANRKEVSKKSDAKSIKKPEPRRTTIEKSDDDDDEDRSRARRTTASRSVFDELESESFSAPKEEKKEIKETPKIEKKEEKEDPLKQIYDLTGFTKVEEQPPKPEPVAPKVEVKEDKKVYTDNLESLFKEPVKEPVKEEKKVEEKAPVTPSSILDSDFSNWEAILNAPTTEEPKKEEPKQPVENLEDTVNQLLTPYGTTYKNLSSLVGKTIAHKDGSKVPFEMTTEDVIKAINAIDGNDLKAMKTVGPEITLLRKVKNMKEGNL